MWAPSKRVQVCRGEYPNSGAVATTEMMYVDIASPMQSLVKSRFQGRTESAVVFLHGNPTSSYLWRSVLPEVSQSKIRCLAPDLIGMGMSGPSVTGKYAFNDHVHHLDSWFEGVLPKDHIHLVLHDWGSALGLHWACRHPERVKSITIMEGIVRVFEGWDEFPATAQKIFQAMRTADVGEEIVLQKNIFIERILPASTLRQLSDDEMATYRAPFATEQSRLPTLTWPRQIPMRGEGPEDVIDIVDTYQQWFRESRASAKIPKLHIDAEPGFFAPIMRRELEEWPNVTTATVAGHHFLQEDSGAKIGLLVREFLEEVTHTEGDPGSSFIRNT